MKGLHCVLHGMELDACMALTCTACAMEWNSMPAWLFPASWAARGANCVMSVTRSRSAL